MWCHIQAALLLLFHFLNFLFIEIIDCFHLYFLYGVSKYLRVNRIFDWNSLLAGMNLKNEGKFVAHKRKKEAKCSNWRENKCFVKSAVSSRYLQLKSNFLKCNLKYIYFYESAVFIYSVLIVVNLNNWLIMLFHGVINVLKYWKIVDKYIPCILILLV